MEPGYVPVVNMMMNEPEKKVTRYFQNGLSPIYTASSLKRNVKTRHLSSRSLITQDAHGILSVEDPFPSPAI